MFGSRDPLQRYDGGGNYTLEINKLREEIRRVARISGVAPVNVRSTSAGIQISMQQDAGQLQLVTLANDLLPGDSSVFVTPSPPNFNSGTPFEVSNLLHHAGSTGDACVLIPNLWQAQTNSPFAWMILQVATHQKSVVTGVQYDASTASWQSKSQPAQLELAGSETGWQTYVQGNQCAASQLMGYSSSVSLELSETNIVYGQSVEMTATVHGDGGGYTPSGSITFSTGIGTLGVVLLVGGQASLTAPILVDVGYNGRATITATYGGDANFNGSNNGVGITVHKAGVSLQVSAAPSTQYYGQTVNIGVTITPQNPSTTSALPVGTVSIYDGQTLLGTRDNQIYTGGTGYPVATGVAMGVTTLQAGGHTISATMFTDTTAVYDFDSATGTANALTILPLPVTVTARNASMTQGSSLPQFSATYWNAYNSSQPDPTMTGSPEFRCEATPSSPAGTYEITCSIGSLQAQNWDFQSFVSGQLTISP